LVEAFALCHLDDPDLRLTLVGGGAQQDQLLRRSAELGLEAAVRVLGAVPPRQITSLLHEHDVLVHPSRHETFGLTPIEAIATGTPVMIARYAAAEEVLRGIDQAAGELFPVGNGCVEIVEAYRRLQRRFGDLDVTRARDALRDRFGYAAVAQILSRYYFDAIPPATETR